MMALRLTILFALAAAVLCFRPMPHTFSRGKSTLHAIYDVKVIIDGTEHMVPINSADTILNQLDKAGLDPPNSCRVGLCTECAALVTANQDAISYDAAVLDPETTAKGFILTCSTRVTGPGVELVLGQHEGMYDSQYGEFRAGYDESQKDIQKGGLFGGINSALNLNTEA
jgi:ferredoxin